MKANHILTTLAATASAVLISMAPSASAATVDSQEATSANWSGYVAGGSSSGPSPNFSSVSGSWVQPTVDCTAADGDAAFWVGLGGTSQGNNALEQVGTEANCNNGSASHFAWYELVPAAPVRLNVSINPGDHVSANVAVNGTTVKVSLTDQTSGASDSKTLQMQNPDTLSAEWIAEAPSSCDTSGCTPLPLANFGTANFTSSSATADGHTGSIDDSAWGSQAVQLSGGGQGPGFASSGSSASAVPTALSSDGSSFSVAWQSSGAQQVSSGSTSTAPGSSYPGGSSDGSGGYGYGYGGGGYGGGGSGYGGGGYGYGGGGYGYGGGGYSGGGSGYGGSGYSYTY
jgi:hypothetical protein